ncbi:MAG: hypothetical protein CMH57_00560 [Myxococcales bacterium]|nr:hypothetical protein [Myxococcales bacterium]
MLTSNVRWPIVAVFAAVLAVSVLGAAPQEVQACETGFPVDAHRYFWSSKPHVGWGLFGKGYRRFRPTGAQGRLSPGQTRYVRINVDAYTTYAFILVGCGPTARLRMSINGSNWSNGSYPAVGWWDWRFNYSTSIIVAIQNTGSERTSFKLFSGVK